MICNYIISKRALILKKIDLILEDPPTHPLAKVIELVQLDLLSPPKLKLHLKRLKVSLLQEAQPLLFIVMLPHLNLR